MEIDGNATTKADGNKLLTLGRPVREAFAPLNSGYKIKSTDDFKFYTVASYSYNKFKKHTGLYNGMLSSHKTDTVRVSSEGFLSNLYTAANGLKTGIYTKINENPSKRDTFELVGCFTPSAVSTCYIYCSDGKSTNEGITIMTSSAGQLIAKCISGKVTTQIPNANRLSSVNIKITPGQVYLVKLSYDGQYLKFEYSTNDGIDWTVIDTTVEYTGSPIVRNLSVGVGEGAAGGFAVSKPTETKAKVSGIDLTKCYFKKNGKYLWKGTKDLVSSKVESITVPNIIPTNTDINQHSDNACIYSNFANDRYLNLPTKFNDAFMTNDSLSPYNRYPACQVFPGATAKSWTIKIKFKQTSLPKESGDGRGICCLGTEMRLVLNGTALKFKPFNSTTVNKVKYTTSFAEIPNTDPDRWWIAKIKYDENTGYKLFRMNEKTADIHWQTTSFPNRYTTSSGTELTSGDNLKSVAYGKEMYVAVGSNGFIGSWNDPELSNGSISWEPHKLTGITEDLNGVAFGNDRFVAIGNHGKVATSRDGITWIERNVISSTINLNSICYGEGKFIAVGKDENDVGVIAKSEDGETWTYETIGTGPLNKIVHGQEQFIIVGDGSSFGKSEDGETWNVGAVVFYNQAKEAVPTNYKSALITPYGILICGENGIVMRYTEDLGWQNTFTINGGTLDRNILASEEWKSGDNTDTVWNSVIKERNRYRLIGNYGRSAYSTDLINWTTEMIGTDQYTFNDGIYEDDAVTVIGQSGYSNILQYNEINYVPVTATGKVNKQDTTIMPKTKIKTSALYLCYKASSWAAFGWGVIDVNGSYVKVNGYDWWEGAKTYEVSPDVYDERDLEIVRYL